MARGSRLGDERKVQPLLVPGVLLSDSRSIRPAWLSDDVKASQHVANLPASCLLTLPQAAPPFGKSSAQLIAQAKRWRAKHQAVPACFPPMQAAPPFGKSWAWRQVPATLRPSVQSGLPRTPFAETPVRFCAAVVPSVLRLPLDCRSRQCLCFPAVVAKPALPT